MISEILLGVAVVAIILLIILLLYMRKNKKVEDVKKIEKEENGDKKNMITFKDLSTGLKIAVIFSFIAGIGFLISLIISLIATLYVYFSGLMY